MAYVDKAALLAGGQLPEDDVHVPGVGVVRVRGLNRAEAMAVQGAKGTEATERKILAFGMVKPAMTEAEVGQWQGASLAGAIEVVSRKIAELSGMLSESAKEQYKSLRDEPGPGV